MNDTATIIAPPSGMSAADINGLLLTAGAAVESSARLLRQGRSHVGGLIEKGDRDYATRVDLLIEDSVRAALEGRAHSDSVSR